MVATLGIGSEDQQSQPAYYSLFTEGVFANVPQSETQNWKLDGLGINRVSAESIVVLNVVYLGPRL